MLQRGALHLRREGMRDRIAEHPETDWRIDIARRFMPILEIGECIPLRHLLFLHCCGVEDTTASLIRLLVSRDYNDGFD